VSYALQKAGYLSGLNNLRVYSLLNTRYADTFGVQQDELDEALNYEGLREYSAEVKKYYNGYSTACPSLQYLYNPWSIINYLSDKVLQPYWVQTGKTDFIANAMWSSPLIVRESMQPLLDGKEITVPIKIDVDYKSLTSPDTIWSLLYFSGYITGVRNGEESINARAPNTEVKRELAIMWQQVFDQKGFNISYEEIISCLLSGNQTLLEISLRTLATELFSIHDLAREPEAFYHGFLLSMLYPLYVKGYRIQSNKESGFGRADIILHPPPGKPGVIIELKTRTDKKAKDAIKEDEDLQSDAQNGLKQIEEKDYISVFRTSQPCEKSVILCCIAIVKKFVAVAMKEVSTAVPKF